MQRVVDDNPEDGQYINIPERPIEAEPQLWHDLYWRAWDALRYERTYGAFGGELPVSYLAISQYARDHDITGQDFHTFRSLFGVIDAAWLEEVARRQKEKT
ncbi:hypothetical protein [Hyphomicrobium sp. ghe19]|uniref:hypothetical protein n=1 Tax=Hyphomicrobium sp. ghe19 TaxID=2682968 RepID=UPI0030D0111A